MPSATEPRPIRRANHLALTVAAVLIAGTALPAQASASRTPTPARAVAAIAKHGRGASVTYSAVARGPQLSPMRQASPSMLATRPSVPMAPCTTDPAWLCGSIQVPIDRAHPKGRTIPISFRVFPHTAPASTARDALLVSEGGPGEADTNTGFRLFQFGPLTDQRDLLLVDNRGTGASAAIVCPALQAGAHARGRAAFVAATGECGTQLGEDADRYGSGDVALDLEDVRKALGYPLN